MNLLKLLWSSNPSLLTGERFVLERLVLLLRGYGKCPNQGLLNSANIKVWNFLMAASPPEGIDETNLSEVMRSAANKLELLVKENS